MKGGLIALIFFFVFIASVIATLYIRREIISQPATELISRTASPDSLFDALFIGVKAMSDSPYVFHLYIAPRQADEDQGSEILTMTLPKDFTYMWARHEPHSMVVRWKAMGVRQHKTGVRLPGKPDVRVTFIPPLDSAAAK
jgi:hypothetical protein